MEKERRCYHDVEAEIILLGCMFHGEAIVEEAVKGLEPKDFYGENNRIVFMAIETLFFDRAPIDFVTVRICLEERDLLEKAGGREHLSIIIAAVASGKHFRHYMHLIKRNTIHRELEYSRERLKTEFEAIKEDSEKAKDKKSPRALTIPFEKLTSREIVLLGLLASCPGRVFSRNELLERVWGSDYSGDLTTVDVAMSRLCSKLGENPKFPKYILADHIPALSGYCFSEDYRLNMGIMGIN